jgi:hypothetical protein
MKRADLLNRQIGFFFADVKNRSHKKAPDLSIQGLLDVAVWLHDLDSNQGPSD